MHNWPQRETLERKRKILNSSFKDLNRYTWITNYTNLWTSPFYNNLQNDFEKNFFTDSQKDTWIMRRIFTPEFQEFKLLQISVQNYTNLWTSAFLQFFHINSTSQKDTMRRISIPEFQEFKSLQISVQLLCNYYANYTWITNYTKLFFYNNQTTLRKIFPR